MSGTSFNLVEMIRGQLTGDVVGRMSSLMGESTDRTRIGLTAAVPQLLSSLTSASATDDGARRIEAAVDDADDGILNNVTGMFGRGFTSESGSGILHSILGGGGLADLTDSLSRIAGLSGKSAAAMLGMLAPIVCGVLKRIKRTTGAGFDVAGLLASERENIAAAMPIDTIEAAYAGPGIPPRPQVVERYATTPRTEIRKETHGWVLPVLLLVGALGLLAYWMRGRSSETSFYPPSTVHAGGDADTARSLTMRSFDELKSKYDPVLKVAQEQGVQISSLRQQGNMLYIEGTAPNLEAANRVWDEIKRVNPSLDDVTAYLPVADAVVTSSPETMPGKSGSTGGIREKPSAVTEPSDNTQSSSGKMYTVKRGDTLGSISRHFYGNSEGYKRIFDANRDKIDNKDLIEVGQELSIP